MQLLIADRFETQTNQEFLTDSPNAHDTDKCLNRASQCRRLDAADADLAARLGAKRGDIEHDADATHRNIG